MTVFKEIKKADKSGVTQFFRLSAENATVETNTAPDFYTFKGNVSTRAELPTSNLSTGDAYYIEDEDKVVFWTSGEWANVETYTINYNYENASNKPSINGHVLKGQMTAEDLDLQPAGDYLTEVPSEYITEDELAAEDYASKTYVIDQINNAEHFHREIVDALPLTGKDNVLYLVPKKGSNKDIYNEYIWTGTDYELMGTTAVDLSDYYAKEEINKLLDKKVDKVGGKGLSTNDYTTAEKTKLASLENYDDTQIKADLAALHNYDDTDIKNDITALKTAENGLKTDVNDIKEELKDKIEGVRLVRSGDMWDFYTVGGTRLTYEAARELLGHPNTILYMEGVENDGKTTPADYDIDEELIHVHYMDEDGEDRYLQMGYPNTASAEGSYIHIEDAVAQPLNSLILDGKCEQDVTVQGKNYYTGNKLTNGTNHGITYTFDNSILKLNGTSSDSGSIVSDGNTKITIPAGTYAYSMRKKSGSFTQNNKDLAIYLRSATDFITAGDGTSSGLTLNSISSSGSVKKIITISKDTELYIRIFVNGSGLVCDNLELEIQIEPGSSMTDFEQFIPNSPSPGYPSEIKVVQGDENSKLKVKGVGENLYNIQKWLNTPFEIANGTLNSKTSNSISLTSTADDCYTATFSMSAITNKPRIDNFGLEVEENTNYTLYTKKSNTISGGNYVFYYDKDYKFIAWKSNKSVTDENFLNFTTPSKTKYICFRLGIEKSGNTVEFSNIMLLQGTITATPDYVPYTEKITNIDLKDNELCSLPNGIKDELVIENNRVKINKKIGKIVLNGTENWYKAEKGYLIENKNNSPFANNNSPFGYCDKFKFQNSDATWTKQYYCGFNSTNTFWIRDDFAIATTVEEFKAWLKANPVTVYYELNEPEKITLSEIDMPATFEGVNNITVDNDLNPNIKIDYVTNINYLDKNIGFKNHYIGYYEDAANLPTGNKGDMATVSSDKRIYINDGNEWIPSDKNSTIDLDNYLAKDNTTGYAPTGNYNPATKKYVDDSVKGINIPTKTSQLTNDSNFVIKTTNELTNYYTKNNTYTKNEVNALVAGGGGGSNVSITVNGDTLVITTEQGGE